MKFGVGRIRRGSRGRGLLGLMALAAVLYGTYTLTADFPHFAPRLELSDRTINPRAPVDPGRSYHLVLWETDPSVPRHGERFQDDLQGALVEFADRYPNVAVAVSIVPGEDMAARLEEAIAAGQPPDVVSLPEPVRGMELQVPVTPYLPSEPRGREGEGDVLFYAAAREPWTRGEHLWGFPRWIEWEAWAGHDGRLREQQVDVDGAVRYGWTWDDVLQLARRRDGEAVREKMALDVADPVLFMQLVANGGAPWWESAEGNLWNPEVLAAAAALLRELKEARAVPAAAGTRPFNRVFHFARREGLLIAPVNAPLLAALQDQLGPEVVLLPVPHRPGHPEAARLTPSGYAVFRQREYRGDGHLRAAMELAYFLSRRLGLATASKAGYLPASPRDLRPWQDHAALHYLTRQFLLDYLAHFPRAAGNPPLGSYLPPPEVREVLAEALPSLWQSPGPTPEAWAERTHGSLRPFTSSTEAR